MLEPGIYNSDPRVERKEAMSFPECGTPFSRKWLPAYGMLRIVDYMRVQDVVSAYPGFKNVPHVPIEEAIY